MRYTESRLSKISLELLRDINKDTVDMDDNFDVTKRTKSITISISKYTCEWFNGNSRWYGNQSPPHNLSEVIDGCSIHR